MRRRTPPVSARQISASMSFQCSLTRYSMPGAGGGFLAGFRDEDHVAVERHMRPLQQQHGHHGRHEVALVVQRAAAVDVAALARGAERRKGPLGGVHADRVAVAHDQQRPLGTVALQPGDQIGAGRILGRDDHRNAFGFEDLLDVLDDLGLVARRIGGVDADQRLEMAHGLVVDFGPIGCLSSCGDNEDAECKGARPGDIALTQSSSGVSIYALFRPTSRILRQTGSHCCEASRV